MKTTGVVRRIDELGRIVIPKEIRKNFRIKEGENLEIFITDNETIALKKYSNLDKFSELSNIITTVLNQLTSKDIIITDIDKIISHSGKDNLINKNISSELLKILDNRVKVIEKQKKNIIITNEELNVYYIINPIIINGDLIGGIILISNDNLDNKDELLMEFALKILTNYIEQ